jgi:DNA recombination protein RmuC
MDLVIVLVIGLLLGLLVGWLLGRVPQSGADHGAEPAVLEARHATIVAELRHQEGAARAQIEQDLAEARATVGGLREQLDAARLQYRETAERHRQDAEKRGAAEQAESKVLQQLAPVAAQLKDMQQKVIDLEAQRHKQHGELDAQIKVTRETAEKSKLAAETLAAAMSNNATRGVWGETQLRTLVESAGLLRRVDFTTQESIDAESGARRPDMVVHLPGGKHMAIDAKVPYAAFIDSNRPDLADAQRTQLLAQHAKAVRLHVDALSGKRYWTGLEASPEFTIAFIPNESILNSALDADPALMDYAFGKGVLLATPVNLWAVLKTVAFTWQQDVLTENAQELFDLGNELYARLAKLSEHVSKLGRSIESTVATYNQFVGSLEGRVLVTARKFDRLDEAKVLGEVTQIDSSPKRLTADEFAALEQAGVDRPEIDFEQIGLPVVDEAEEAG